MPFQKGYIPTEQHRKNLSKALKGKKSWLGKKHTKETKIRMSIAQQKRSKEISESHKGEKNWNWKGGITKSKENNAYKARKHRKKIKENKEIIAGRKRPEQCEICGSIGKICFDHNHKTGKFRGWLCTRCNLVLGHVKDNVQLLKALSEYLEKDELSSARK